MSSTALGLLVAIVAFVLYSVLSASLVLAGRHAIVGLVAILTMLTYASAGTGISGRTN